MRTGSTPFIIPHSIDNEKKEAVHFFSSDAASFDHRALIGPHAIGQDHNHANVLINTGHMYSNFRKGMKDWKLRFSFSYLLS
jgi:hypothetical protein